jgi:hypothetical protein
MSGLSHGVSDGRGPAPEQQPGNTPDVAAAIEALPGCPDPCAACDVSVTLAPRPEPAPIDPKAARIFDRIDRDRG